MVGFPAARKGDPVTHDMLVPSGTIGPPLSGPCPQGVVLIENLPAAHVNCTAACTGAVSGGVAHPPPPAPVPIMSGSATVFIHNMPAARWTPSGDMSSCGAFLGDPKLAAARTVLVGGGGVSWGEVTTLGDMIAAEARNHVGSPDWSWQAARGPYGPGTNKCNLFVYEVLNAAGAPVPMMERLSLSEFGYVDYPPLAGQWGDPDFDIPGWQVVDDPQPGDVVAIQMDYADASGHVGIVTGDGTTASVSSHTQTVVENDWGFRKGQKPVFRRYAGPEQ